jgi:hypothetical protein
MYIYLPTWLFWIFLDPPVYLVIPLALFSKLLMQKNGKKTQLKKSEETSDRKRVFLPPSSLLTLFDMDIFLKLSTGAICGVFFIQNTQHTTHNTSYLHTKEQISTRCGSCAPVLDRLEKKKNNRRQGPEQHRIDPECTEIPRNAPWRRQVAPSFWERKGSRRGGARGGRGGIGNARNKTHTERMSSTP